uniref:homeobox-leucine zipper protein MERISTEM L1-like isoform X1 n=1 Tax=Fragaria vesca subsp. vesca TaxID=101020 RepID=UPI0005CA5403|nr:PREDICTED: homeobox-leucine zipper protein MERISTEM L1-like isoform X1 [Fragaria vesca subsp. vesca]
MGVEAKEFDEALSSSNGVVKEGVPKFLEMQECYNICMAAYKEIMTLALKANTWVVDIPVLGSIEKLHHMFREPPSPGMEIEYSIESGIVPLRLDNVVTTMTNVDEWASVFCNIVHNRTAEVSSGVMSNLAPNTPPHNRDNFKCVKTINAELLLPMPCAPTRKFSFIRFLREVIPDVWAVVDVSTDYFPHLSSTLNVNCKRRPSGVIVRRRDDHSEVIWIENMEIHNYNVEDSIYSGVNSNLAFDAKHWISMLLTKEKRIQSKFVTVKLPIMNHAFSVRHALLTLARRLKMVFLSYIAEHPDENKWDLLSDTGIKILKDTDAQRNNYMAVTTSRVEATPLSVFNFLVKRNRQLQWPCLEEMAEPEEVINLVTDDHSNCITIHAKRVNQNESTERVMQTESTENFEYVLQEASKDEFCSFIISSQIDQSEVNSALGFGQLSCSLRPFGFSIIPDGSRGHLSDASIVTMACQLELEADLETGEVIERMSNLVSGVFEAINGVFTVGEETIEL